MTAPTREHYLLVVEQALRTISAAERALPVEVGPGSTVADIADWAARFATAATDQLSSTALAARPPGQDPAALAVAGPELLSALATTPMRRPCWTPSPAVAPQAAFWLRRSAHALSVRAWQVQVATDQPAALEPWLLLDGIDEHLRVMLAVAAGDAQTPTGRARGSIAVRCTDVDRDWTVQFEPGCVPLLVGDEQPDATLVADAATLRLGLAGMLPLPVASGEAALLAAVRLR